MRTAGSILFSLLIVLLVNLVCITPAEAIGFENSSLTGLVTLKNLAKSAIPYQAAIATEKPILLEFYADWCSVCQAMSPIVRDIEQEYEQKVNLVMVNIDQPENNGIVLDYGVVGVPQFTFLDSQHQVVDTFVGKIPKQFMAQIFEQLD